ncbi:hypothetical protein P7K49_028517, partial [Saguinus oedipus]
WMMLTMTVVNRRRETLLGSCCRAQMSEVRRISQLWLRRLEERKVWDTVQEETGLGQGVRNGEAGATGTEGSGS